jgi:hypothetical protein
MQEMCFSTLLSQQLQQQRTTTRRKITHAFPPRDSFLALARVNSREEGARITVLFTVG